MVAAVIISCLLSSGRASAESTYDDLLSKITTKTLINYIDNYYGKTCGSPNDDYAQKWLYTFRQANSYRGDPAKHQAAVRSLEKAISSPNGAYLVIYEQNNNHNNTSNPYFLRVFWTEDGRADYKHLFYKNDQDKSLYLSRKENSTSKLYTATIASPKFALGSMNCAPQYISGYNDTTAYISDLHLNTRSYKKLFTSTFPVEYPEGYNSEKIPNNSSALTWKPTSSDYDDFVEKITTKKLINRIKDYGGFNCGPIDYSDRWLATFKYPNIPASHLYHKLYMDSLERAMAGNGAYVVAYEQTANNPYFITVYWSERKIILR